MFIALQNERFCRTSGLITLILLESSWITQSPYMETIENITQSKRRDLAYTADVAIEDGFILLALKTALIEGWYIKNTKW